MLPCPIIRVYHSLQHKAPHATQQMQQPPIYCESVRMAAVATALEDVNQLPFLLADVSFLKMS